MQHIVNYALNKFCPYIIIFFLLFYNSGVDPARSTIIVLACLFVDKFSFKSGYSVAFCHSNNIPLDD